MMKQFLIVIAILATAFFFWHSSSPAFAAITFDASSTAQGTTISTLFQTTTVGTGSNQALFIIGFAEANVSLATVTVDGVSATKYSGSSQAGGATTYHYDVWYALGLSSGTHNVTTTWSGGPTGSVVTDVSLFGVNQSTPAEATSTNGGTSTSPSSTITTITDQDVVIAGVAQNANSNVTNVGSGLTSIQLNAGNGNIRSGVGRKLVSPAHATTTSFSFSANNATWAMGNVAVVPAAATSTNNSVSQNIVTTGMVIKNGVTFQ